MSSQRPEVRDQAADRNPQSAIRNPQSGFTLIELVSVLAIIVVLLSIALGSYSGWTRISGIDAAANLTATILSHAREQTITQGSDTRTRVHCLNITPAGRPACGLISLYTTSSDTNGTEYLAMPTNVLPAGVCFRAAAEQVLEFLPDGTCRPVGTCDLSADGSPLLILDSAAGSAGQRITRVVEVNPMSGRVRVRREDEP